MEDLYTLRDEPQADALHTPYPVVVFRAADFCVRETDDPPSPPTARQQLARALRWHRVLNG